MAPCRSKVIDKYDLLEPREKESACVCVCVCVACHKYVCTYRRCVYFFFFFFSKRFHRPMRVMMVIPNWILNLKLTRLQQLDGRLDVG